MRLWPVGSYPLITLGWYPRCPGGFADTAALKDWFRYHRDVRSTLKNIRNSALTKGHVDMSDFSGIFHNDSSMEDSTKLTAYRYRRAGSRQRSLVLVNGAIHADAPAAVEAVIGAVTHFAAVEHVPGRRARRQATSMDTVSQSVLDQLFGLRSPDITGLRSFGSARAR